MDIHVVERVKQARLGRSIVDLLGGVLHPLLDSVVVLRPDPFHDLSVAQVDLGLVQAQGVPATLGCCLHPQFANGLPVELDRGDVGLGHLGVQLGQFVEEGGVDQAHAVE